MANNDRVVYKPEDIEKFRKEKGEYSFDFTGVTFICEVDFPDYFSRYNQENKFEEGTSFERAVFERKVSFRNTQFLGDAIFLGAEFSYGKVDFLKTKFLADAYFSGAKFSGGSAEFIETEFSGEAYFIDTEFSNISVYFLAATFSEDAVFSGTKFSTDTSFLYAMFIEDSYFGSSTFSGYANFMGAQFNNLGLVGVIFKQYGLFKEASIETADRETFRIIKHEFLKTNNRIDALEYHKREMKAYWSELCKEKWHKNIGEKCILFLNLISTYYGTNWIQGVGVTIGIAFIFYWAFLELSNAPDWSFEAYFRFLNPAHSYKFLKYFCPLDSAYIVDAFGRVFIGYGYYQTIQAFRKYKKV
ncbi:MAG: pentapeptide repeat-containing protein [Thermotogota bacterium]